jgi:thiamine pyrophosphokinase
MNYPIVYCEDPVSLVGGGEADIADLTEALGYAPTLVAADGGASLALSAGHVPCAVYGDFDSMSETAQQQIPPDRLHRIAEQDSTDFDKALRHIQAPVVVAVGFLGARVDHQLAAFNTLVRYPDRPCILIGAAEITVLAPRRLALDLQAGDIVSIFPMMAGTGRSSGLEWPIDGLSFAPGWKIGTSNRATGPVVIEADEPGLLLILPRRALPQLIAALHLPGSVHVPWTARA